MLSWLCTLGWLAFALPFCPAEQPALRFSGYVEGEYVSLAPREAGRIVEVAVRRGDRIDAGTVVARLEDADASAAVAAAQAELSRAQAQLADLESGRRPEEIAVTRAQLAEAEAGLAETERELQRQRELFARDHVAQAVLDAAEAAYDSAAARVEALSRQIAVEKLPARAAAIDAARSAVAARVAQLEETQWRLSQRTLKAPIAAVVDAVLRRPGEMAAPDAPVVSLLPDENRVVRFFVPEALRATVELSGRVALSCDGCPAGLEARVRYVAAEAEYTPPVIYSVESRQKLVYMVEAVPLAAAGALSPGQIVDVTLPAEPAR
jgi:HlyD family secretion protein